MGHYGPSAHHYNPNDALQHQQHMPHYQNHNQSHNQHNQAPIRQHYNQMSHATNGSRDGGSQSSDLGQAFGAGEQGLNAEEKRILEGIAQLMNPATRESALLELSKKREQFPQLALILWHSFGELLKTLRESYHQSRADQEMQESWLHCSKKSSPSILSSTLHSLPPPHRTESVMLLHCSNASLLTPRLDLCS